MFITALFVNNGAIFATTHFMSDIAMNSYEVSFIVKTFKPHWDVGMDKASMKALIPSVRQAALLRWGKVNADHEWLKSKAFNFWHYI